MAEAATTTTKSPQDAALERVAGLFGGETPNPDEIEQPGAPGAPAVEGSDATAAGEPQAAEATGQDATPQQPQEVEVEIDGERYLMPAKIADKFIHHADYSRKTMDVAELRRVNLAEQQQMQLERAFAQATAEESQQAAMLDAQIAQYKRVDWQALETDQLMKAKAHLDMLKDQRADVERSIAAKRRDFDARIQGAAQEAVTAGSRYIEQHIPKFGAPEKSALFTYGIGEGYTRDEMQKLADPRIVVTLWKASQWDALQASKPGVTKRASQAAPAIRPGATQPKPNRIAQLAQEVKKATTSQGKRTAAENLFAAKFGGR